MFVELTIVVDGALDTEEYLEPDKVDEEIVRIRDELLSNPIAWFDVEVYTVDHDHPKNMLECECVQFLTDHHPKHRWVIQEGKVVNE